MSLLNTLPLFFGNFRGWEWIIIIVLGLVLFGGAARITKTMRNVGKGVNAFKQGIEEAKAEINKPIKPATKDADVKEDATDDDAAQRVKAKDIDR